MQLLLRNLGRIQDLQNWMTLPESAKSLLVISARSAKGRARAKMAGSEVWAVVAGLREALSGNLSQLVGSGDDTTVSRSQAPQ